MGPKSQCDLQPFPSPEQGHVISRMANRQKNCLERARSLISLVLRRKPRCDERLWGRAAFLQGGLRRARCTLETAPSRPLLHKSFAGVAEKKHTLTQKDSAGVCATASFRLNPFLSRFVSFGGTRHLRLGKKLTLKRVRRVFCLRKLLIDKKWSYPEFTAGFSRNVLGM